MKILKIEFQNINSLKGEHQIDFTEAPFTTSSLFAITGPTGSGKSSILDVISLALFNKVPRLEKVSKGEIAKTGAILTRNQKEAKAAVTYESKNGRYRSEWSISTAKTGSLREYKMQLSKAETGELLDLKKSEVPARNEELIGLNYNQFIKSVLLAQGEFAQFLKAKKDERGELLEKITGTGIYRQIGKKSYERFKEVNKDIELQQHKIAAIKEQLLHDEQYDLYNKQLEQKNCDVKKLEQKIESFKKHLELKNRIIRQEKEIRIREDLKSKAEDELQRFEQEHGAPLKEHEKIEPLAEELRSWSQLNKEIRDHLEEIETTRKAERQNTESRQNCLSRAATLTGYPVDADSVIDNLEAFAKKVNGLQQEKTEKGQAYKAVKNQLLRELQGIAFQLNEGDPEESREQLTALKKTSEERIALLRKKLKNLDLGDAANEKERLSKQLRLAQEAWRKEGEIQSRATEIGKLQKEEKEVAPTVETFPAEIEIAKGKADVLQERLEKLHLKRKYQLLEANYEAQRHILQPGEPCPLCGSREHPYGQNLPEKDDAVEAEIALASQELDAWKNKWSTARANWQQAQHRLDRIKQQQKILEQQLEVEKEEFTRKYGHLCPGETSPDWETMCHNWQDQIAGMQELQEEERRHHSLLEAIPLLDRLKELLTQGKSLREELEKIYQGEDVTRDTGRLSTQWSGLQQEQKNLQQRVEEMQQKIREKSASLQDLEVEILPEVQQQDFSSIANAREALMSENECRRLRAEREEISKKITAAVNSLSLLRSQLEEYKKLDVEQTLEALDEALVENRRQLESTSSECREIYSHLKNHDENIKRLQNIQDQIAEKEKQIRRWRLLNELIGDATGKKFNDFAQDLSLDKLLQLANIRLRDLSDRYRIDKPDTEEDDALVAIDEHMGGQRRSVKTLSGGETFLLSLSMALALSDLASRNVEINSLFIDEGFGTLDPETLDQTLDTLEKLQAESSKTIGIISHVDSLKERIATQVKLKRNGQGYSQLELTPRALHLTSLGS